MTSESGKSPMKIVWTICGKEITIEADDRGNVFVDGDLVERSKTSPASTPLSRDQQDSNE